MRYSHLIIASVVAALLGPSTEGCTRVDEHRRIETKSERKQSRLEQKRQYAKAKQRIDAVASKDYLHAYSDSTDGHVLGWAASRLPRALLIAYEASGDAAYLDTVEQDVRKWLASRADRIGVKDAWWKRRVPGWATTKFRPNHPQVYLMHSALLVDVIAKWAYLTVSREGLSRERALLVRRALRDAREAMDLFDDDWVEGPGAGEGHYGTHHKPHESAPLNGQTAIGRAYLYLWLATGNDKYHRRVKKLSVFFRNRLTAMADGGPVWGYWPPERTDREIRVEDIVHASISFSFAIECWKADLYDDAFMSGLAKAYERCVRIGDDGEMIGWTRYLDGTGEVGNRKAIQCASLMWWSPSLRDAIRRYDIQNSIWRVDRDAALMLTTTRPESFEKYRPIRSRNRD